MSAENFVVFYGLRFTVAAEEVEAIERRIDGRLRAARDVGLRSYWGSFSDGEDRHMLLISSQLGVFGAEGDIELELAFEGLSEIRSDTDRRLVRAGLIGRPALHMLWKSD